jgi:putative component of membrane protein insertase Oxa1/YidC/SpoIIIJ protein YidD
MFGYQRFISQQLGSECAFEITCSEHAKMAVERYGIFKGSLIGFYQLQSCTAKTGYDYPNHSINKKGEIINPVELNED